MSFVFFKALEFPFKEKVSMTEVPDLLEGNSLPGSMTKSYHLLRINKMAVYAVTYC